MTIRSVRRTFTAVTSVALALTLAACDSPSDAVAPDQAPAAAASGPGRPAVAGTIASVDSASFSVRSTDSGQVTVNYSGTTTFTARVPAALADIVTGSCVIVIGTGTPVAAQSVDVSDDCERPAGGPTRPPNGSARPPLPSGANGPGGGGRAMGTVTAVSGTGFTVRQDNPQTSATAETQVTVSGSTVYTKAGSANASALKAGECVVATGQADSAGVVTATTIAISQAGPDGCAAGGRRANG